SRKPTRDKPTKGETREDRLKAALKANLSRRKAQAAARSGPPLGGRRGPATRSGTAAPPARSRAAR
ncbi:MAG: hypothetical protein AAFU86_15795, partial [Pseudomonadota bacterium]